MNSIHPFLRHSAFALLASTPLFAGTGSGSGAPLTQQVNAALGLESSFIVPIVVEGPAGGPATAWVGLGGKPLSIALRPSSVQAEGFQVLAQGDDGSWTAVAPVPSTTVRGEIVGLPGSVVAGARTDGGLEAWIRLSDGTEWWVQPLSTAIAGAPSTQHVLYSADEVIPLGICGLDQLTNPYPTTDRMPPHEQPGGAADGSIEIAQLGCDADYEYYVKWGSTGAVQNRIESVINTMNAQYQSQVGITHVITTILVRTSPTQPYTSKVASTLLNQFRNQWNTQHSTIVRDVAHLFTGKNIQGSTIGIAWIGVVCNKPWAYGLAQSDFSTSFAYVTDLSAHEIGHNWNAGHCSCPSHTMNSYITGKNSFHPTLSIPQIVAYRNSVTCLD
jgi:hypothetical protein